MSILNLMLKIQYCFYRVFVLVDHQEESLSNHYFHGQNIKYDHSLQIVATFRCLPGKQGGYTSGTFKTVLLANNLIHRQNDDVPTISSEDVSKCKNLAKKRKSVFDLLSKSLAPSIHGHDYVKKALLCMLLGGVEKILPNGSRLRGDINILLIGTQMHDDKM